MPTKTLIQRSVLTLIPILALAFPTASQASPIGGEKVGSGVVGAFTTDIYNVSLYGGEMAMVVVSGDTDTDLDLYVYDAYGRLIASDTDYTDQCIVRFRAPQTGSYQLVIAHGVAGFELNL